TTITVTLADDTADEPTETLTLIVTGDINGMAVRAEAIGTIRDNDDATISVSALRPSITEADNALFIISTGGIVQAANLPVAVNLVNAAGDDFLDLPPGTTALTRNITIATGSHSATLTIALDDDDIDEAEGSIIATVAVGAGYTTATGGADTATITVNDNDLPIITLSSDVTSVIEGQSITFTLTATTVQTTPLRLLMVVNGFGRDGGNFLDPRSAFPLTIPTGSSTVTETVTPIDDLVFEQDGFITAILVTPGSPATYRLGDPSRLTVNVSDNDVPGSVLVNSPAASEDAGPMRFVLTQTSPVIRFIQGDPDDPSDDQTIFKPAFTVYVSTRNVSAIAPDDYTALDSLPVLFPEGVTSRTVEVTLTNDSTNERDEQFSLLVSDDTQTNIVAQGIGTIFNDDPPTVSISAGATAITEGDTVLFTISTPLVQDGALTVNVSVTETGGEYLIGRDPQAYRDRQVVIRFSHSSAVFSVRTDNDRFVDATGTIIATVLGGGADYAPDSDNDTVEVTVNDNDGAAPDITISAANGIREVTEGSPAEFVITSSVARMTVLAVNVMLSEEGDFIDDTGLAPVADGYTVAVDIPAESRTVTLSVNTVGDTMFEADGEIVATVQTGDGYMPGADASQRIRVLDNGLVLPTVHIADAGVDEGAGSVDFVITLRGGDTAVALENRPVVALGEPFMLMYETSDGTGPDGAIGGTMGMGDYWTVTAGSLNFGASATARMIRIRLNNDQVDEMPDPETFTLRVYSDPNNPSVVELPVGGTTVTGSITDNDTTVSIAATDTAGMPITAVEEGDPVVFTLTVADAQSADIPVRVYLLESTRNGQVIGLLDPAAGMPALTQANPTAIGALVGGEYHARVIIPGGSSSADLTVVLNQDMMEEPEANFSATVQRVRDGRNYLPAGNTTVTVQVTDGDLPIVSISADNTRLVEGNDIVYVLSVSPVQSAPFIVDTLHRREVARNAGDPSFPSFVATTPRTLLGMSNPDGSEYEGMAIIPEGHASVEVAIGTRAVSSMVNQGRLAVMSIRSTNNPTRYTIDVAASAIIFTAEDVPQITVTSTATMTDPDAYTVSEGVGNIEFVLTLDKVPLLPAQVRYATSGGSLPIIGDRDPALAYNAEDFTGASSILLFDAGKTVATITVAILDDEEVGESDEDFWLVFSDAKNIAVAARQRITIIDNDDDRISISIAAATTTQTDPDTGRSSVVDVIATEGDPVVFILTADSGGGHKADIVVGVTLSEMGDFIVDGTATSISVTIGVGESSATLTVATHYDGMGGGIDEADGSITATLQASANYQVAAEPNNSATVLVLDDDLSTVSIVHAHAQDVISEGEVALFIVTATTIQRGSLTVNIMVTETGDVIQTTALSPLPPMHVAINPGESTATLRIATEDDLLTELDSRITATITPHADYVIGTPSAMIDVTADDNVDVGAARGFRIHGAGRSEMGGGPMVFSIALLPTFANEARTMTVDYATSNGSAEASKTTLPIVTRDYEPTSGTLTFIVPGATTVTLPTGATTTTLVMRNPRVDSINITVTINDDGVSEDEEVFFVDLSNPVPDSEPLAIARARGTIRDDDRRLVGIMTLDSEIAEGEGAVFHFTVNRESFNETVINLTADDPGGYLAAAPTTVTIAGGERNTVLTVATVADSVIEADDFVRLRIASGSGYTTRTDPTDPTISVNASARVRVASDDTATLVSIAPAGSVGEGDLTPEGNQVAAQFIVTARADGGRTFAPNAVVTVGLLLSQQGDFIDGSSATLTSVSNGSGGNGGIYSASVTLTANNLIAILPVAIDNDDVDEASGMITATLQSGSHYTLPSELTPNPAPDSAVVGVTDNDYPSLSLAGASTTEGVDATLEFVLTLSAPSYEVININAATSNGTATAGSDYTIILVQQVSFAVDETSRTVTVAVLDDTVAEGTESLYLVVSGLPTGMTVTNDNNRARGDIRDDEVPVISIATDAATTITEGTAAVFRLTPLSAIANEILVFVDVSEQGNYRAPGSGAPQLSLRLFPGQSEVMITVNTVNDSVDEADGSITATLSASTDYSIGAANSVTFTVEDDDNPSLSIRPTAGRSIIFEGETARFTISAATTTPQHPALTVGVRVANTSASFATPPLPTMAVIPAGATSVVLSVATNPPNGVADKFGVITATVLDGDNYNLDAPVSVKVYISDDTPPPEPPPPPPEVSLLADRVSVYEHAGVINFVISIDKEPGFIVPVAYQTVDGTVDGMADGTANSDDVNNHNIPIDYEAQIGTVLFDPGNTNFALNITVSVPIVDDAMDEADEAFRLQILNSPNATIGTATAVGTILNDDDTVSISTSDTTVSEAAGNPNLPQFTLTASAEQAVDLMVVVSVDNGPGSDFLQGTPPLLVTVTIPAASSSSVFTLSNALENDGIPEADGSIIVTVLDDDFYNPASDNSVSVAVTDDDRRTLARTVSIVASASAATEGTDSSVEFTVSTASAVTADLSVTVFVPFSSYIALSDVGARTLTITATNTSATFTVAIIDDEEDEVDGNITASLQADATYYIVTDAGTATVAVSDDEPITVRVEAGGTSLAVTEGPDKDGNGGEAVFSIIATTPPPADLSVAVEVKHDREGEDFLDDSVVDLAAGETAATLTITIGASSTGTIFTVALDNDNLDEQDGGIRALVLVGPGYTVSTVSALLVVEDDDDPPMAAEDPTLTATDASSNENVDMVFEITLNNPTSAEVTALLHYRTADGTAIAGRDYDAIIPTAGRPGRPARGRSIGFIAGASSNTTRMITVAIIADNIEEPDKTFTLEFIPASGIDLNKVDENGVNITDNGDDVINTLTGTITDKPVITITAGQTAAIAEGTAATFTLAANFASSDALMVNVSVSEMGSFIDGTAPDTVIIAANASTATLTVATLDDNFDEMDGSISVSVSADSVDPTTYVVDDPDSASVMIEDNDDNNLVRSVSDASADEGGDLLFVINRGNLVGRIELGAELTFGTGDGF
ncbi:MAG: Calx-beta domain-containing protein, partial [Pseudohongiellaceae bacterium]